MYLGLKIIGKTLVGTQWKLIIGIRGATKCSSKDVKSKSGGFLLMDMLKFRFLSDVDNKFCKLNHILISDILA